MLQASQVAQSSRDPHSTVPLTAKEARERWWSQFEPLWVPGLAVFCLLVGHAVFRSPLFTLEGKSYDYAQYAIAGTLYPLLLFGVPLFWRWRRLPGTPLRTVRRLFAATALVWLALFIVASVSKYGVSLMGLPLLLSMAQTLLMSRPWRRNDMNPERLAAIAVVAMATWTIAFSFGLESLVQPRVFLAGFIAAFVLACSATWHATTASRLTNIGIGIPTTFIAMAFIAFMSLRTEDLFEVAAEHGQGAMQHWGAWVGSAELVRQGGWLLWDVPSMYGFLSILPLAVLPTRTPWQSLYLLQALSFFLVAAGVFLILRTLRPGGLNWCLALATAVTVPMFSPTFTASAPVGSTFVFPNAGAYRYIWCFVLVMVLMWAFITRERSRCYQRLMIGGCLIWVAGVLWSPESAVFCSGVWLPAYAGMVFRQSRRCAHSWRMAGYWLAVPLALLGASVAIVSAVYVIALGNPPDWLSYVDYVFGLGTQVLVVVNDPTGPALVLLLAFCVVATATWYAGFRLGKLTASFALFGGLLGGIWATGIYGYTRSNYALHPMAYVAIAITLVVIADQHRVGEQVMIVRAAIVPLLTLLLVSPLAAIVASPLAVGDAAASLRATAANGFAIEPLIPDADESLQALMSEAGIGANDPVSFQGSWLGNLMQPWRPAGDPAAERIITSRDWLPGHPYVSLRYVPEGRGPTYMRRFIDRTQRGGWLIQHKTGDTAKPPDQHEFVYGREPWFFSVLGETHVPTRILENDEWQLVWFEYVGRGSDTARPDYDKDRGLAPLPVDVTVDGQPLAGQVDPAVWVLPGQGWGWYNAKIGARWVKERTVLWIYARASREVSLHLRLLPDAQPALVQVAVGEQRDLAQQSLDSDDVVSVSLRAGWNRIVLRLLPGMQAGDGWSPGGWFVTGLDIRTS
jgi:hypothetical protein